MKEKDFGKLVDSIKEEGQIKFGNLQPSHSYVLNPLMLGKYD